MDICAFSSNGKYFSLISPDGRLKIWDAETNILKQEYTPDLHLSSPPTCLFWLSLGGANAKRKRKSSNADKSDDGSSYVALGTGNGKILLYSVEQAKVEGVLSDGNNQECSISCLDWSPDRGLFSCSSDAVLREWNITDGGVRQTYKIKVGSKNSYSSKITAIKLLPNLKNIGLEGKLILLGCSRIKLYNLTTNTVVRDFTGHSADVTHLSIANFSTSNKCFAISACKNERIISLWNLSANDKTQTKTKKKSQSEISYCNFLLEDVPMNVCCSTEDAETTSLVLAAVTRTGSLHYYSHILNGTSSAKAIKPNVTIQVATEEARPMPALCSHLAFHLRDSVTIAYVSSQASQSIIIEKITPDLSSKSQVLVRQSSDSPKGKYEKREAQNATKVRRGNEEAVERDRVTYLDGGGGTKQSNKRTASGKQIEVPMESRLANLSLEHGGSRPTEQNMGQLLLQGLHSNDKKLLLSVLQCTDAKIAYNSVSRLPPRYLNPLLLHITELLTRKTSQAKAGCVWLSATLKAHSSLLLATSSTDPTSERIAALLSALALKRSSFSSLLALKGRLTLTLGQLEDRPEDTNDEENAILEYRDTSDSDSMDGDALGPLRMASDDENSWDDDQENVIQPTEDESEMDED